MFKSSLGHLSLLVTTLALRVSAACTSYGVDYASGGTYNIDVTSHEYFTFTTVFQGMSPCLMSPEMSQWEEDSGC